MFPKIGESNALSKPVTSNSVSTPQVSKGVNNDKVIAPGMFRISPDKISRDAKKMPNTVSASFRTKPITVSQPNVITQPIVENLPKIGKTNALSKPVASNTDSTPQESKNVNNDKVIAPGMSRINPFKTSREEKQVPNTIRANNRN
nr:hypothetical protein [Tanacetum cinerariifolium]